MFLLKLKQNLPGAASKKNYLKINVDSDLFIRAAVYLPTPKYEDESWSAVNPFTYNKFHCSTV